MIEQTEIAGFNIEDVACQMCVALEIDPYEWVNFTAPGQHLTPAEVAETIRYGIALPALPGAVMWQLFRARAAEAIAAHVVSKRLG